MKIVFEFSKCFPVRTLRRTLVIWLTIIRPTIHRNRKRIRLTNNIGNSSRHSFRMLMRPGEFVASSCTSDQPKDGIFVRNWPFGSCTRSDPCQPSDRPSSRPASSGNPSGFCRYTCGQPSPRTGIIRCTVLNGNFKRIDVFLPRIPLTSTDERHMFFTRLQFPVKLAFAMTKNRAQGQLFRRVGLHLK